ncbi:MAG TPA: hypothetical protein PKE27_11545 [Povalibacter sp.]|uniref:hypothetical protein n=1 Tax=Povalibacter sp. TaxID=1962978 RepID=UPI002C880106|nr:hypothetical protein [Povalibacter sp.]HMN45204.1 hypothetical protein [Povalibacter sp.]
MPKPPPEFTQETCTSSAASVSRSIIVVRYALGECLRRGVRRVAHQHLRALPSAQRGDGGLHLLVVRVRRSNDGSDPIVVVRQQRGIELCVGIGIVGRLHAHGRAFQQARERDAAGCGGQRGESRQSRRLGTRRFELRIDGLRPATGQCLALDIGGIGQTDDAEMIEPVARESPVFLRTPSPAREPQVGGNGAGRRFDFLAYVDRGHSFERRRPFALRKERCVRLIRRMRPRLRSGCPRRGIVIRASA